MIEQSFGSPDGGDLMVRGLVDSLVPPNFAGTFRTSAGVELAVNVMAQRTLEDFSVDGTPRKREDPSYRGV